MVRSRELHAQLKAKLKDDSNYKGTGEELEAKKTSMLVTNMATVYYGMRAEAATFSPSEDYDAMIQSENIVEKVKADEPITHEEYKELYDAYESRREKSNSKTVEFAGESKIPSASSQTIPTKLEQPYQYLVEQTEPAKPSYKFQKSIEKMQTTSPQKSTLSIEQPKPTTNWFMRAVKSIASALKSVASAIKSLINSMTSSPATGPQQVLPPSKLRPTASGEVSPSNTSPATQTTEKKQERTPTIRSTASATSGNSQTMAGAPPEPSSTTTAPPSENEGPNRLSIKAQEANKGDGATKSDSPSNN